MTRTTNSPAETEAVGQMLAARLRPGDVVAFRGGLGAGKTAFVRGLARGLGICEPVTSPTYTIVNEYEGRLPLFHFDLYRLDGIEALEDIGWEDYLARGGVCCLEWSENAPEAAEHAWIVTISRGGTDQQRIIEINRGDGHADIGA